MHTAKLIAMTVPVTVDANGFPTSATPARNGGSLSKEADEFIAYCARVSNPGNQGNHQTAPQLIRYLMRNAHWSPFEMSSAVMEITTTRDIARQILRHRSFSFQEFSQRYGAVQSFVREGREARLQDTKNRQSSTELDAADEKSAHLQTEWSLRQSTVLEEARKQYEWALEAGIAKEVARSVLPEGLTMSKLYMAGTIRSWIHYVGLRTGNGTQKEHKQVAMACFNALSPAFPSIFFPDEQNRHWSTLKSSESLETSGPVST